MHLCIEQYANAIVYTMHNNSFDVIIHLTKKLHDKATLDLSEPLWPENQHYT